MSEHPKQTSPPEETLGIGGGPSPADVAPSGQPDPPDIALVDMHEGATAAISDPDSISSVLALSAMSSGSSLPTLGNRYKILSILGRGAMGAVYKARDITLDRPVALKFLHGDDPHLVQRMMQEARTQARIDHPNVCKIYEVGEVEGKPYIAMQLINGGSLDEVRGELTQTEKVVLLRDVALAMHEAHRLGVVHRDIKPTNIMLERTDAGKLVPIVMDFGVARDLENKGLTETGAVIGTPAFMSPEQVRGELRQIDRRSDVYSLGATLYDLLSSQRPFDAPTVPAILFKVMAEEPRRLKQVLPSVSPDLETTVMKCLQREPQHRYDSARALAEDLDRFLNGEPILGRQPGRFFHVRRFIRRHPQQAALLGVIGVLALGFGGLTLRARTQAARLAERTRAEATLARQVGQEIKDIEWLLRSGYLLPLHDAQRERDLVRQRMERLTEKLKEQRAQSDGLLHYALGRGYLTLREYARARSELEQAQQAGQNASSLHYALGLTLGRQFDEALALARRRGDKTFVARERRRLDVEYLQPALGQLNLSNGADTDSPHFLAAVIAFYQSDYSKAEQEAEAALVEAPWVYEARKLIADIEFLRALGSRDRGQYDKAEAHFQKALANYDRAAEQGRSDPETHIAEAEAWLRRIEMNAHQGRQTAELLPRAEAACARARAAAPERSDGDTHLAGILLMLETGAANQGKDPGPWAERGIAAARAALARNPDDPYAYEYLGNIYLQKVEVEMTTGLVQVSDLEQAMNSLEAARRLDPMFVWANSDLGTANNMFGAYMLLSGRDGTEKFKQAMSHIRRAMSIDPEFGGSYLNYLSTLDQLAAWSVERGIDPSPYSKDAHTIFKQCIKLNPNSAGCHRNFGIIQLYQAQYDVQAGNRSEASLEQAIASLRKSQSIKSDALGSQQALTLAHLLRVEAGDKSALADADTTLRMCLDQKANDPECLGYTARREWLAARQQEGPAARRALDRALGFARRAAVEAGPQDVGAQIVLAEACWRRAKDFHAPERILTEGLTALDRALAKNSSSTRGLALRAGLQLLQSRRTRDTKARQALVLSARSALDQALANNPLLLREFGSLRDESAP